ncbi:hypothetical protein QJQ45_003397 [Haematococcus lacustris]|nr:hypothetical protein QJQ45_003397 [Haematococcus lacustris]
MLADVIEDLYDEIDDLEDELAFVDEEDMLQKAEANARQWLDRDTNGCLNLQRIGESMKRPLELCSWKDLEALPAIGKEYQQGYKWVNDRLPKGRQRLHRAAEYGRGIDGRARNNA